MHTKSVIDQRELHHLLNSFRAFAPQYDDRLSNHLPMAITALWRIGANTQQIQHFAQNYSTQLACCSPLTTKPETTAPTPGSGQYELDSHYFATILSVKGKDTVLSEWVPRLLPGLSTAALHCLIRTAYAVESECIDELAKALGYWSADFKTIDLPLKNSDSTPGYILNEVIAEFSKAHKFGGNILDQMHEASRNPYFSDGVLLPPSLNLEIIRNIALDLYSRCEDFTLLHTVTACHALRIMLPYIENRTDAYRYLWQGFLLAVATVSGKITQTQTTPVLKKTLPDWNTILKQCRNSDDDHAIKLVYTAWRESAYGDELRYREIAARKLGL